MTDTLRTALVVIVAVVLIPLLWGGMMMAGMGPWMMGGTGPWMMGSWEGRWGTGWGLLMMVPGLLIFALIVAALVWGFGRASTPPSGSAAGARDILDAGYARGEITREQYQRMRGDLGG